MKHTHFKDRYLSLHMITSGLPKCQEPLKVNAQCTGEKATAKVAPSMTSQLLLSWESGHMGHFVCRHLWEYL